MTRRLSSSCLTVVLLALASVITACEEDPVTIRRPDPATLLVNGADQTGTVGERLAQDFVISVRRTDGSLMPNVQVALTCVDGEGGVRIPGHGSASGNGATIITSTGSGGTVIAEVTLGPRTGLNTFRVSATGIPTADSVRTVYANALPGPVSRVIRSGDGQVGQPGQRLGLDVALVIQDRFGNAVPGVEVQWSPASGAGSVNPGRSNSDGEGLARTAWTLGPALGSQTVDAEIANVGRFRFQATSTNTAPGTQTLRAFLRSSDLRHAR
jgi:hypothetical protein